MQDNKYDDGDIGDDDNVSDRQIVSEGSCPLTFDQTTFVPNLSSAVNSTAKPVR